MMVLQVLGGIGTPLNPREFYFHLHSQLASLGITGVYFCGCKRVCKQTVGVNEHAGSAPCMAVCFHVIHNSRLCGFSARPVLLLTHPHAYTR